MEDASYTMILTGGCVLVMYSKCQLNKSEIRGVREKKREEGGAMCYKNEGRQVNQKFFELKSGEYRDCIKGRGDKIGMEIEAKF